MSADASRARRLTAGEGRGGAGAVKCLVVEGDPSRRRVLGELLRRDGHEALEAADPTEGWALQRADPFDLIVLDVDAPGGFELCRRIRDQGGSSVVLALLGSTDPAWIGRVLDSGASVYAETRLDLSELETRLRIVE